MLGFSITLLEYVKTENKISTNQELTEKSIVWVNSLLQNAKKKKMMEIMMKN